MSVGVKHQDSQNSFLAFLNAPTSALDQFDVSSSTEANTRVCFFFFLLLFVQTNVFVSFLLHSLVHQDSYSSSSSSLIEFWEDVSL